MSLLERLSQTVGVVGTLTRAGLIAPLRPDCQVRMGTAVRREGMTVAEVKENLAIYEVPRDSTGKTVRRELQALLQTDAGST